ncbi:MAG: YifB family Mg chelatase-like AAA ATPase [Candidatus Omnitrophica bacterium]|nr:YifB family Mg chelatase-like AAA ATPase [Candidatus Omnitrophota bacterium]
MISTILSATHVGIDAHPVTVEVDAGLGLPGTTIVGLPDQSVKESRDRVKAAIRNSGFRFPTGRITVNLAPADIKKEGPSFDLPIALGILAASGFVKPSALENFIITGELALDGSIRMIKGALPIALLAKTKKKPLILPYSNATEAALEFPEGIYGARSLREAVEFLNGEKTLPAVSISAAEVFSGDGHNTVDFSEIRGQHQARRALEVAVSGGHNVIMIGPPGAGKTMLAMRMATILPPLTLKEALMITKIHSVSGLTSPEAPLVTARPFRSPHHTISAAGLVGGGSFPKPGEISLAHHGVLFLDELPEFHRDVLETLRGPLEDGSIIIVRAKSSLRFPSQFTLIAAMNPCPCGYLTDAKHRCHCTVPQIQRYLSKISGPLLDRIDIQIEVPALPYKELKSDEDAESSLSIRERVIRTRKIQEERFGSEHFSLNARMTARAVRKYCRPNEEAHKLLEMALHELSLSARAYHKVLKLSRTIADMEGSEGIREEHIAEAIQYRSLDRSQF